MSVADVWHDVTNLPHGRQVPLEESATWQAWAPIRETIARELKRVSRGRVPPALAGPRHHPDAAATVLTAAVAGLLDAEHQLIGDVRNWKPAGLLGQMEG